LASIILAVWYPYEGAQVFSLPLGGSCVKVPYAIGGSGSSFIYGYVDSNFREKMTLEEAKTFVKNGIDCYLI
jgi:20S proteasome subunit beta 1